MQKTLPPIGRFLPATRTACRSTAEESTRLARHPRREIATPPSFLKVSRSLRGRPRARPSDFCQRHPSHWSCPPQDSRWQSTIRPEDRLGGSVASVFAEAVAELWGDGQQPLPDIEDAGELQRTNVRVWERCLISLLRERGDDGAWAVFISIRDREQTKLLALPEADLLRDGILAAALGQPKRTDIIIKLANALHSDSGFTWPNLYTKVIRHALSHSHAEHAIRWHLELVPNFSPTADRFRALITTSVLDPSPATQKALTKLYTLSSHRGLYDHIIPIIFCSGQSKLALHWRKVFISCQDLPAGTKSRPFLQFVMAYYSTIRLSDEEILVTGLDPSSALSERESSQRGQSITYSDSSEATISRYSDSIIAKWFASTWFPLEIAINLVFKLGVRKVGPRSLQSLALRENNAEAVAKRLAELSQVGITVVPRVYCQALVFFATQDKDALLSELLNCDIHPDEFENEQTRQLIRAAAKDAKDRRIVKLIDGVESALRARVSLRPLESNPQSQETIKGRNCRPKSLIDSLEAFRRNIAEVNASAAMACTFKKLTEQSTREKDMAGNQSMVDHAIKASRRLLRQDVAVAARYWRGVLISLGRLGRFNELEHLSLELVKQYKPRSGGLILVHRDDWPHRGYGGDPRSALDRKIRQSLEHDGGNFDNSSHKKHIPADLPATHPHHPLRQIFNSEVQESIIKFGFKRMLSDAPATPTLKSFHSRPIRQYDLACGVRLIAILRDRGVHVDVAIVRNASLTSIAYSQMPVECNSARDRNELQPTQLKRLFDVAWGSELLSMQKMQTELIKHQGKVYSMYRGLLRKFDT